VIWNARVTDRAAGQPGAPPAAWLDWLAREISRSALARAFIVLVFPLGLVIGFITPPGQVDDEPTHMCRAAALWHGALIGKREISVTPDGRTVVNAGVTVDPSMVDANFGPVTKRDLPTFAAKMNLRWTHKPIFIPVNPIAIYFPVFYVPAALGIGIAHLAGIRPFEAVYAGRLVSYLCYFGLGLLALLLARRAQTMIFVALSVPMALALGASCNPDGLLIATTALGVALFSRGAWKSAAFCMAMVSLVKPPYALLALPLLLPLPPLRSWLSARHVLLRRFGLVVLTVLPGVLWFAYAMVAVSAPTAWPAYHPGPLWPGNPATIFYTTNPGDQLQAIHAHPREFLDMIWAYFSLRPYQLYLIRTMIGVLGWLMIILPPAIYHLWLLAAAGAVIADITEAGGAPPSWPDSVLLLAGILVTICLIWLSQYLNWTLVGLAQIQGPSGRYLLPLVPVLGLALPRLRIPGARSIQRAARCLPVLAVLGTLILLPRWLAIKFYLGG